MSFVGCSCVMWKLVFGRMRKDIYPSIPKLHVNEEEGLVEVSVPVPIDDGQWVRVSGCFFRDCGGVCQSFIPM